MALKAFLGLEEMFLLHSGLALAVTHLVSPFALVRSLKLMLSGSTCSKKYDSPLFPNFFNGLFPRWKCEIDTMDLGNVPSGLPS